jgi:hypothetical protein
MGKSKKFFGDSPHLISVAALLSRQSMSYRDNGVYVIVSCTKKGSEFRLKFPKDWCSDALRFASALQEKIPKVNGQTPVKVLPAALPSDGWGCAPNEAAAFIDGWRKKEMSVTFDKWGGAFLTYACDYKRRDGTFPALNLGSQHYYNIVIPDKDLDAFHDENLRFHITDCLYNSECRQGYPHYHAVHGYYARSNVNGVSCAPPWRFSPDWKELAEFIPEDGLSGKEKPGVPYAGCGIDPDFFIPKWMKSYWPTEGASVLAATCQTPMQDWTRAEWFFLSQLYKGPNAARWALARANESTVRGHKAIRKDWERQYNEDFVPMLNGYGVPIFKALQQIWAMDCTTSKVYGNFLLRRLVTDKRVTCDADGVLKK